jgi:hypothetical protein
MAAGKEHCSSGNAWTRGGFAHERVSEPHARPASASTASTCRVTDFVAFECQRPVDVPLLVLCRYTLNWRCSVCQLVKRGDCLGALRINVKHVAAVQQSTQWTQQLSVDTPKSGAIRIDVSQFLVAAENTSSQRESCDIERC